MFHPLSDLLKTLPTRSKTPDAIIALHVRQITSDVLVKNCSDLPKELIDSVRVLSFKNGVLSIRAPHLVGVELQMRAHGLIRDINRVIGKKAVFAMKFKVG